MAAALDNQTAREHGLRLCSWRPSCSSQGMTLTRTLNLETPQREALLNIDSEVGAVQGAIVADMPRVVCARRRDVFWRLPLVVVCGPGLLNKITMVLVHLWNCSREVGQKRKVWATLCSDTSGPGSPPQSCSLHFRTNGTLETRREYF